MKAVRSFAVATALAALCGSGSAKNQYIVKEDALKKEHLGPLVENTTQKCAYDTASFRLCGNYGAKAKIGWEWEQEFYNLTE